MIAALILAAGRAKRMGQLKQILPWGKDILLGHTINLYQEAGMELILVVVGYQKEQVMERLANRDVIWVENNAYLEGMSSSIKAGLNALPKGVEAILLALGDLPLIKPKTIKKMINLFHQKRPSIIVPTFHGKTGHPVLLAKELFPELYALSGDIGARNIIKENPHLVCYLEIDDPGILRDVDEPETYHRLRPKEGDVPDADFD